MTEDCVYYNNGYCTLDPRGILCECSSNHRAHGVICPKKPHDRPEGGYLHDESNDGPYDVDG
jgi:hypothetical protein